MTAISATVNTTLPNPTEEEEEAPRASLVVNLEGDPPFITLSKSSQVEH
jgi:hypothetical protein